MSITRMSSSSALAKKHIALKLVENVPYSAKELHMEESSRGSHSLHLLVPYQGRSKAEYARYFIDKYTEAGDVVLDSFCGSGTTPLEAALKARNIIATDINPFAVLVTAAKLRPADIAQVTLALQMINLKKPVDTDFFASYFEPFYDIRTFCELLNLRSYIFNNKNRINDFLHTLVLSLLHGHSSGHFSGYSYPQLAPSPAKQLEINAKRRQYPDYRAIVPRLIKRAATVLRDGVPSVLERMQHDSCIRQADSRNLDFVNTSSVDFTYMAPPLPGVSNNNQGMWLRNWFSGIDHKDKSFNEDSWLDFMNESLLEKARVSKSGARAVVELREESVEDESSELLSDMVTSQLSSFWNLESLYTVCEKHETLKHAMKARARSRRQASTKFLVLRRK